MNICVFGKYKVSYTNKYDYVSDYDWEMKQNEYSSDKCTWRRTMQGGEFIDFIAHHLTDMDTIEIRDEKDVIYITKFNPNDGTGSDIRIKYTDVTNKKPLKW